MATREMARRAIDTSMTFEERRVARLRRRSMRRAQERALHKAMEAAALLAALVGWWVAFWVTGLALSAGLIG